MEVRCEGRVGEGGSNDRGGRARSETNRTCEEDVLVVLMKRVGIPKRAAKCAHIIAFHTLILCTLTKENQNYILTRPKLFKIS